MKLIILENVSRETLGEAYAQLRRDGFLLLNQKPEIIELTETEKIKFGEIEIEGPVEKKLTKLVPTVKMKAGKKEKKLQVTRDYTILKNKWTDEIKERVADLYKTKKPKDIARILTEEFEDNYTANQVSNAIWRFHLRDGIEELEIDEEDNEEVVDPIEIITPEMRRKEELEKQKRKGMSEEAVEIIEENYMEHDDEELRFNVNNGITLCAECHGEIHGLNFSKLGRWLKCKTCGEKFKPKSGHLTQKTCSKKCGYEYRFKNGETKKGKEYPHLQNRVKKICVTCGREFEIPFYLKDKQKYCSRACIGKNKNHTNKKARKLTESELNPEAKS